MVATTVREDEETPPPSTPLSVSTLLSRCVQLMCIHSRVHVRSSVVFLRYVVIRSKFTVVIL